MKQLEEQTPLGEKLKGKMKKLEGRYSLHGAPVYEITEDIPELRLKKGDALYIDRESYREVEVFTSADKGGKQKLVIGTDGKINEKKTANALGRPFSKK